MRRARGAIRLAGTVLRHPSLAVPLARAAWRFRSRRWYLEPPFVPLPPARYLDWRLHTAYGDEDALPAPDELRRYLAWVRRMDEDPTDET